MNPQQATAHASAYRFEGREVTLPVEVRDASSVSVAFLVDAGAARRLLDADGLEIAEVLPNRTLFTIAAIDYRDNDLGDYNELSMAFFVRERGAEAASRLGNVRDFLRGTLPTYIHRLPVNQSFTCAAGRGIWGFPKSIEDVDIERTGSHVVAQLRTGGTHVLTLASRAGGRMHLPRSTMLTYSRIDGRTHRTRFVSEAEGVGVRLAGAKLALGEHPIAAELRSLGLPKRPILSVWIEHMRATFEGPEPI